MSLSYDEVPYPSYAYSYTHPDTLATRAHLMGLDPAPVDHCRVLELGCAGGGNILPMAVGLPGSEFVGLDYALRQVEEGQATLSALGLTNTRIMHMDILDVDANLGIFDYIIVHGIYSWVPPVVQRKILDVCRENLAPNGVAYVSYNAYPGWHILGTIRQMMLYHTRDIKEPLLRAAQARALMEFLVEAVPAQGEGSSGIFAAFGNFLKGESKRLKDNTDSYILHDELEEVNQPFYFHEFAATASEAGLDYLCEADLATNLPGNFPPAVSERLMKMARDMVEMEQYMDYLRLRSFRRSLLIHQDAIANRSIKAERVAFLRVASQAKPSAADPDMRSVTTEQFIASDGATLTTDHPASKAAMVALSQTWPLAITTGELLDKAYDLLDLPGAARAERRAQDRQVLCGNLLRAFTYSERLVELHYHLPNFTVQISERPMASAWARLQAETTDNLTNLRHERVEVSGLARFLLPLLDGTRDHASLVRSAARPVAEGTLTMHRDGSPVAAADAAATLDTEVNDTLCQLARFALLAA